MLTVDVAATLILNIFCNESEWLRLMPARFLILNTTSESSATEEKGL